MAESQIGSSMIHSTSECTISWTRSLSSGMRTEFWREFSVVVPLDHTLSTQRGKTVHTPFLPRIQVLLEMLKSMYKLYLFCKRHREYTMRYQCYNLMIRQWKSLLTSKRTPSKKPSLTSKRGTHGVQSMRRQENSRTSLQLS